MYILAVGNGGMIIERKEVKCMRKTGRSFKRAFSLVLAALFVCMTLAPCAFAAETTRYKDVKYEAVKDYTKPSTVISVTTSSEGKVDELSTCPWKFENGRLQSGNANIKTSESILVIAAKGSGVLSFKYRVSAPDKGKNDGKRLENAPDSLLFWKNNDKLIGQDYISDINTPLNIANHGLTRVYGETDWTTGIISVPEANAQDTNYFYFMYKKNDNGVHGEEDCAWLTDIVFSDGNVTITPVSSDTSCGTVSGSVSTTVGEPVTVTAQLKDGSCKFYGWYIDGGLVSNELSYTFTAYPCESVVAVFGNANTAAQNLKTGNVYNSLADAMDAAKSGDTVMLLNDCTVSTAVTIPEGVKVYVPYSDEYDEDGNVNGTAANSTVLATADKTFRTLTVANGGSINVEGTLCVGGVIGYPGQYYQGHTSGAHGRINNLGSITVASGGVLDCWGYIDGSGKVVARSGAKVFEPFVVYDFSGGSNTIALNSARQSPFTQYTMQNISCDLDIYYGAALTGRCNLYAASDFNKADAVIVGAGGLTSLASDAVLHRTVDKSVHCGSYCPDLGKVTYTFDGGAGFSYLEMYLAAVGAHVTTKNILFPIPYGYDYILKNGTYNMDTDIALMPGAKMIVENGAELRVNDRFVVLDGLKQNSLDGKAYPSTDMLKAAGYPTNAVLIVNGTMTIAPETTFLGTIQTGNIAAKVITDGDDEFSADVVLGADIGGKSNKTILPLKAQVMMNGSLTQLECSKTYYADSTDSWTLSGYSVNPGNGMVTVTTNQAAKGSFSLAAPHTHVYDQRNTSAGYLKSGACCTSPAVYYFSCTCGEMGTATFTYGNKTDHNITTHGFVAASCTENGYTGDQWCTSCEKTITAGTTIPALGHDYGNGNKCVRCGAEKPGIPGDSGDSGNSGGFFSRLLNTLKGIFSKLFGWLPFC